MINKILFGALLAGSLVLAGCSSDSVQIKKLDTQVQSLGGKVDALEKDVTVIAQDAKVAKQEASRANQRLDNQVNLYKK